MYRLHRETFHLAASYVDRYLKVKRDIQKSRLQLVGVTALFIAAKLEEIYPPKLSEFSYVTDGACTDDEIVVQELVMLKVGIVGRTLPPSPSYLELEGYAAQYIWYTQLLFTSKKTNDMSHCCHTLIPHSFIIIMSTAYYRNTRQR